MSCFIIQIIITIIFNKATFFSRFRVEFVDFSAFVKKHRNEIGTNQTNFIVINQTKLDKRVVVIELVWLGLCV